MKILFAASEVSPFAKKSELAEVIGALPVALHKLGHDVRVITPKYKMTDETKFQLRQVIESVEIPISNRRERCSILEGRLGEDVPVYFVKNDMYYHRDQLYGDSQGDYPDNAERFMYFSKSILEICKELRFAPDIVHCHDWQTGLVPIYLRQFYRHDPAFSKAASVYTIHHLDYQGLFWHYDMHLTGLGWELFTPDGLEFYGKINLMKGGLLWADLISTISKTYSQEIQTKNWGFGLDGVLQYRSNDLYGVVNGVDYTCWNPETDPVIAKQYGPSDLSGKTICKQALLNEYGLPVDLSHPVVGVLSPWEDQKGFDLIAEIVDKLLELDLYLVFLGTGHEKYQRLFRHYSEKYPQKFGIRMSDDGTLVHKIEAGADMLLMPSRHEPCGVYQIYSLKYGAVPIVYAAGGLNDTIKTFHPTAGTGTGVKFTAYKSENLFHAVKTALETYQDKTAWQAFMIRGMQEDFSWDVSAKEYEKLYKKALDKVK